MDRAGSRVPKISMTFDMSYNRIFFIFHVSEISFSTGLLAFHANYQVENRAGSQVPNISMTFDMIYNMIYHLIFL